MIVHTEQDVRDVLEDLQHDIDRAFATLTNASVSYADASSHAWRILENIEPTLAGIYARAGGRLEADPSGMRRIPRLPGDPYAGSDERVDQDLQDRADARGVA